MIMTSEPIVCEKHNVLSETGDVAKIDIQVRVSNLPYKLVRGIEDEIHKFVGNLKGAAGAIHRNLGGMPYSDEEKAIIEGGSRDTAWDRFLAAFPNTRRTRGGVRTYYKKWENAQKKKNKSAEIKVVTPQEGQKPEPPAAPPVVPPTDSPRTLKKTKLSAWQLRFLMTHGSDAAALRKFRHKWPKSVISDVTLIDTHKMMVENPNMAPPVISWRGRGQKAPEEEIPPVGGVTTGRFKVDDRVIQVSGLAPAPGIGIVKSVRSDGVVTVKFISAIKVLHTDNFALAPPENKG